MDVKQPTSDSSATEKVIPGLVTFVIGIAYLSVAQTILLLLISLRLLMPESDGGWLFLSSAVLFFIAAIRRFASRQA